MRLEPNGDYNKNHNQTLNDSDKITKQDQNESLKYFEENSKSNSEFMKTQQV